MNKLIILKTDNKKGRMFFHATQTAKSPNSR